MRHHRSSRARLAAVAVLTALALLAPTQGALAQTVPPIRTFDWVEASMDDVRAGLASGRLTCTQLVQGYLDRIATYDRQGPALASMITVSDTALEEAAALDLKYRLSSGTDLGRLHCAPVVVKDNIDVAGMPTTAGSSALINSRPPDDAFIVERLRDEGAVVLGKANLDEFAFGFGGNSTTGGQARNAYHPPFGPGGSSSGTATAVSASLAMFGLGTDTGGSIRVPSSVQGLVGIRPSMRLLSQDGIVPLALFQDTAGPMCRTVEDCASLLEVLAAYDDSPYSGQYTLPQQRDDMGVLLDSPEAYRAMVGHDPSAYRNALDPDGLQGARIGVVRALFGSDPEVRATLEQAIEAMRAAGATVEDVTIPDLNVITGQYVSMSAYEFRDHLTRYLQSWPSDEDGHPRTFEEVRALTTARQSTFTSYASTGADRYNNATYNRNTLERPGYVRPRLLAALNNTDLEGNPLGAPYDALMYPSVVSLPRNGAPNAGSNNRLSPFSGFPALSMPAGFTAPTANRPALPVGMELLGREFDEPTLLRLAYAYQESVEGTPLSRTAPTSAPELPDLLTFVREDLDELVAAGGITEGLEAKIRHALDQFEDWDARDQQRVIAHTHLNRAIHLLLWQADVIEDKDKPNQGDPDGLRALAAAIAELRDAYLDG